MAPEDTVIDDDIANKIEEFYPQYETNDCFPTCIRNMIVNISLKNGKGKNPFKISKGDINVMCEYTNRYASSADMKMISGKLNKEMKSKNFRCIFKYTDRGRTPEFSTEDLKQIIRDDLKSLPTVTLSKDYFGDSEFPWDADENYRIDHTVIILEIDENNVFYIWDGLISYNKGASDESTIVSLPEERFMRYWVNTYKGKETCWIEKETRKEVDRY
ncbi:MAG: hypothetical protein ACQESD_01155 [Thermoplasmatota archaeon]